MRSLRIGFALSVVAMLAGFASCPAGPTALPALREIATAENAQRALVIAQSIRVERRDHIARAVSADGRVTSDEMARLIRFDDQDVRFTRAWSEAYRATIAWQEAGGSLPSDFAAAYELLLSIAGEWATRGQEIRPVVVED